MQLVSFPLSSDPLHAPHLFPIASSHRYIRPLYHTGSHSNLA